MAENPRRINSWLMYRDQYSNKSEVGFTVKVFFDTLNPESITIDTLFNWKNYDKNKIEIVRDISVNSLPGIKISGSRKVLMDDETSKNFFLTEWLLQGDQKVYNIVIGSYNKKETERALERAELMVSTFAQK